MKLLNNYLNYEKGEYGSYNNYFCIIVNLGLHIGIFEIL